MNISIKEWLLQNDMFEMLIIMHLEIVQWK